MTKTNRRKVLALLGSSALSACAAPEVITRSNNDPFEGGIGGTGIVGLLTDFGSLIVNGLRVEMTGRTRIVSPFGDMPESALAPGMALTVFASRSQDALIARRVAIDYALVGTVRRDPGGQLTINGVTVMPEPGATGRATPGTRIAVSGVWSSDGVIASRFDPAPDEDDLIAGTVEAHGVTGRAISDVPIRVSGLQPLAGQYTIARGRYNGSGFDADTLLRGRFEGAQALRQLSVEGYLEPIASNPGFRVAGLGHSFARNVRLDSLSGARALYFGRYDGRFDASRGYVVPDNLSERRRLLRSGLSERFDGEIIRI